LNVSNVQENKMKLKILGAAALLAVALPLASAAPSYAQSHRGGAHVGGGGHFGGGHMGGGRSFGGGGRHFAGGGGRVLSGPGVGGGSIRIGGGGRPGGWHGGGRPGGWHGGGHWHRRGGGFYPGLAAGALIGGALAAPYAYGYDYDDSYYDDGPAVEVAPAGGDSVAYCQQRFKSYDPASGTYLGYDGIRHPCP
jgi:hypothetical protein